MSSSGPRFNFEYVYKIGVRSAEEVDIVGVLISAMSVYNMGMAEMGEDR